MRLPPRPQSIRPSPKGVVDWAHPLSRGLIYRWLVSDGAGTAPAATVGGVAQTTNAAWLLTSYGKVLNYNGTSHASSAPVKLAAVDRLTVAFDYYRATSPTGLGLLMELSANANSNTGAFYIAENYNVVTNSIDATKTSALINAPGGLAGASFTAPARGSKYRVTVVFDRSQTAANAQITAIYLDGVAQTLTYGTATGSPPTGASTFRDDTLYFMARAGSAFWTGGRLSDVALWSRCLSPTEVWQEASNPYANLAPRRAIPFDATPAAATHATSGALAGGGAALSGTAAHIAVHATSGDLAAAGAAVAGTAARTRAHPTTGVLEGAGASIAGDAAHIKLHATSGDFVGAGATLDGVAARVSEHATSGDLAGAGAQVAGTAARIRIHTSDGVLAGAGAAVAGVAARTRVHATTAALAGAGASVAGSAARLGLHATTGVLAAGGAALSGTAAVVRTHLTTGALTGQGSITVATAGRAGRLPHADMVSVLQERDEIYTTSVLQDLHITTPASAVEVTSKFSDSEVTRKAR
jgi:hypothetical protein